MKSAFVSYEELWRFWKGVICRGRLLDLHNSSYDTQPHSLIVKYSI